MKASSAQPGALILALSLAAACGGPEPAGEAAQAATTAATPLLVCEPATGTLDAAATANDMAGEFVVELVGTQGMGAGKSATGLLALEPFAATAPYPAPPSGGGTLYPLYGRSDIAADSLGVRIPGGARSMDPTAPGVLVMQWEQPAPNPGRAITIRLGADSNRPASATIDGSYTALHVLEVSADRFVGRWESGGGSVTDISGGHFCANRVSK